LLSEQAAEHDEPQLQVDPFRKRTIRQLRDVLPSPANGTGQCGAVAIVKSKSVGFTQSVDVSHMAQSTIVNPTASTTFHPKVSTMVAMNSIETLGERLKSARIAASMSQTDLADVAGVSKQAISKIENNWTASPATTTLEPIARVLGVSLRWLLTGANIGLGPGLSSLLDADFASDWSDIKGIRQAASLGDGAAPDEYSETHKLKFRADSLRRKKLRPEKLAVLYGRGDSMSPTIEDGDAILFDTSDTKLQDDKVYIINYDGQLLAKRLVQIGDVWCIASDNTTDPKWRKPIPIDAVRGFQILGRVRWVAGWLD
jgi:phage repressor protein C with HTH and peptisase S24 domain